MKSNSQITKIGNIEVDSITQVLPRINPRDNSCKIVGDTHTGLVREVNEDSFAFYADPKEKTFIAMVADGIGGHEKGDEASQRCCKSILTAWLKQDLRELLSQRDIKKFFTKELTEANNKIFAINAENESYTPMGTTFVSTIFLKEFVILANIGDSRCYRLRNNKIQQLSEDHTLVYELFKKKLISESQLEIHPLSHVISKAVGTSYGTIPDVTVFDRMPGDCFLLCSDGLTKYASSDDIKHILKDSENPSIAVSKSIQIALQGGGDDNVTVLCIFD